ncbi:MAG: hypothetical protein ACLSAF_11810 [Intestinimonas sp.]
MNRPLHFQLKEELGHAAVRAVKGKEHTVSRIKLTRSRTRYKIVEETTLPDDSIWY